MKRGARQVDQYLVEWKGYPISEATWEPLENLTGSIELVTEFNKQQTRAAQCTVETILARTFAQVANFRSDDVHSRSWEQRFEDEAQSSKLGRM